MIWGRAFTLPLLVLVGMTIIFGPIQSIREVIILDFKQKCDNIAEMLMKMDQNEKKNHLKVHNYA